MGQRATYFCSHRYKDPNSSAILHALPYYPPESTHDQSHGLCRLKRGDKHNIQAECWNTVQSPYGQSSPDPGKLTPGAVAVVVFQVGQLLLISKFPIAAQKVGEDIIASFKNKEWAMCNGEWCVGQSGLTMRGPGSIGQRANSVAVGASRRPADYQQRGSARLQ